MKRLQPLDIVRTAFGTIAVVDEVSTGGSVSLVLPAGSSQKYAWYEPKELVFVARTKDLVDATPGLTQAKPPREKPHYPKVFDEIADLLNGTK